MNSVKFLIISILSIACIDCLFFELSNSEEKCFIEELTIDNVLFIKYKLYEVAENSDQIKNIQIKISKGDGDEPLSLHSVKRIFGKHSFTAKDNGNYKICVFLSGSSIFNRQSVKMRLRFDSDGSEEKDLSETLQTSDVNFSTKHIKRIINKGIKVLDHQKYNIDREDNFSQAHMSYSKTFIYMTISQIVIVLVLGIYNIISFRNFLVQKNII